jgi:hypothetical protein
MIRRRLAVIGVLPVLLTAACAGNSPGELSSSAAKVLRPAVQDVRQAAATGTYADLRQAVQRLKDLVRQEQDAGEVSSQRAVAIENAADVLLQDARPESSSTPTPTTTSESPTPTPTSESPTPTPTSESPTPEPTSESPTPTATHSPAISVSAGTQADKSARPAPSATSSPSASSSQGR